MSQPSIRTPRHGRFLEEFELGAVYRHPWEVTIDAGTVALFQASFLDATPVYASAQYARALGFQSRPLHPLILLNFGLSFSVHDVSEQAIAHLAYIDVRFPSACYDGDTVRAHSTVLGVRRATEGNRGVVHVRTVLTADDARVVCQFERKVLVKAEGPSADAAAKPDGAQPPRPAPAWLQPETIAPATEGGFDAHFERFTRGDTICHAVGKTVGESEHMQLTYLFRNTHPLHFEEPYAKSGFAKTRVVYGGLVFAWIASLASRDTTGNAVWDAGFDKGAHPGGVVAGDTLYAASRVLATESLSATVGSVTFKLVGTKNVKPATLLEAGADLFADETAKKGDAKIKEKVFEIERTVWVRKRAR